MNVRVKNFGPSLAGAVCLGLLLLIGSRASAQTLFATDYTDNNIYEFSPGGAKSTLISGLNGPFGIAFNKAGVLFEADQISGSIYEITNGTKIVFASGLHYPAGLAFDHYGNLFVSSQGDGVITKIAPNGTTNIFASGLNNPLGLAFDSAGNLYVACYLDVSGTVQTANVYKYTTNGTQSTFASGGAPWALAFDGAGNLFVANAFSNNITKITPGQAQSTFATLYNPQALAFDPHGNLFVADGDGGNIIEITPAGVQSTNISGLTGSSGIAFAPVPVLGGGLTNASYQLSVSMPSPYYSTVVQSTTNLLGNWTPVCTNTPPFIYTNLTPTGACRFYRTFLGP